MDHVAVLRPSDLTRLLDDAVDRAAPRLVEAASRAAKSPAKAWLTNREAQTYLGLSRATLARYRASGTLPFSKVGQAVFYRLSDIEALLDQNMVGARAAREAAAERRG